MQQSYSVLQGRHKPVPLAICSALATEQGKLNGRGRTPYYLHTIVGVFPDLGVVYRFLRVTNFDRRLPLDSVRSLWANSFELQSVLPD